MATVVELEHVRGLVGAARRMLVVRTTAWVGIAVGLLVLAGDWAYLRWLAGPAVAPDDPAVGGFFRLLLAVMVAGLAGGGLVGLWRYGGVHQVADHVEGRCPELGLRVTTSLETPQMDYCPPAMRRALYGDTVDRIGRSGWSARVIAQPLTALLCGLALLLVAVQVALSLPWPGRALIAALAAPRDPVPDDPVPDDPPAVGPEAKPTPFEAVLEIPEPGGDQWASKIDGIPLKVRGTAPHGFANLRIEVTLADGQVVDIPLEPAVLAAAGGEATAWINLDEFALDDFDVLTYEAVGDATKDDGNAVRVASEMCFIQIRPFDQDFFLHLGAGGGSCDCMHDFLKYLIEQQRAILRATGVLRARSGLESGADGLAAAAARVETAQRKLEAEAREHGADLARDLQDRGASPEMIVAYDQACELMGTAVGELRDGRWGAAIPPEHQAIATLVDLLRTARNAIEESKQKGGRRRKMPGLEDDLLVKREREEDGDPLENLIRAQQEINRDRQELQPPAPPNGQASPKERKDHELQLQEFLSRAIPRQQELAGRQRDLAAKTDATAAASADAPKTGRVLAQAAAAMQEHGRELQQAGSAPNNQSQQGPGQQGQSGQGQSGQGQSGQGQSGQGQSGQSQSGQGQSGQGQSGQGQSGQGQGGQGQGGQGQGGQGQGQGQGGQGQGENGAGGESGKPGSRPHGEQALAYLRQAAEVRRIEQLERQAAALGEMLDTLSRQQERMERQPAAAAEQDEMAARLADAQRQLEQMASRADGPRRDAVQHAADEAGQASSTFESHEGRPENLERPMAALAEAQQETLGEARHVAAVLEEINRLHGEVRRLSEIVEKDPTKIESEVVEEWVDAFRRREGAIEKKVSAALGAPTDGLSRRLRRVSGAGDGHAGDEALTPFALDEIAEAIGSAQAALRERLRLLAQRDQLLTMQGQSVPRDYREQVTAYFLKLSREEADAAAAAAEAAAP